MKYSIVSLLLLFSVFAKGQSLQVAQNFLDRSDYKHAIPLYEKIIEDARQRKDIDLQVTAQNGLADCYMDLGANYKAMSILKKNIALLNKPVTKNYLLLAKTHQLLAIGYDKLYLIEDYLTECNTFYNYYKKAAPDKEIYKALYYAYVGRYYNMRFIIDKSFVYTSTALKIYHKHPEEKGVDPYVFYNAHLFTERNNEPNLGIKIQYVDSLTYLINKRYPYDNLKKARLMVSIAAPNIEVAANLYYKRGDFNVNIACADRAISIYNQAIAINDKLSGFHHANASYLNSLKGLMFFYKKDYKTALENYEMGIKRLTLSPYIFTNNNAVLFDLLKWKAWCLDDMYTQNKDTKLLFEIDRTLLLEEKYWMQYANAIFKNKQEFNTNVYTSSPYNELAKNYYKLYRATGECKYISMYFENNEKSKYTSLLENLNNEKKEQKWNISSTTNEKTYEAFEDLILKTNNKIILKDNYKSAFEKEYKIYTSTQKKLDFVNKEKLVSLKEVQTKLKDNEAILSYNVSGYQAHFYPFILMITKSKVRIAELMNEGNIVDDQPKVVRLIESLKHNDASHYKKLAFKYYSLYFQPIEPYLPHSITQIQIIPSTDFCNLPFDMLVSNQTESNDFSKLPYLAKKYQFSYGLSSSISKIVNAAISKSDAFSVLSPSFDDKQLSKLNTANTASKIITDDYNATLVQGKVANKQLFSKHIKNDKVVALFSHGKATTDENEMEKGIYLSDGFLSMNAIYNLEAHCDFLLLGSCESGVGFKENREGNINLARAFTAIGVKSMMLASWKIDEKSSAQIIRSFLKYLDSGCTKSEALQKAKLDYLATASPRMANPLYWAGLNITGNNETIRLQQRNYWWWGLGVVVILVVGGFLLRRNELCLFPNLF